MESPSSHSISRRDFVKITTAVIGGLIGAGVALPVIGFLLSPALRNLEEDAWVRLGPLEEFPVGVPTPFQFTRSTVNGWEKTVTSHSVFAIRKDGGQIMVLSNVCTHLGCLVSWHPDLQEYISPCHNGHFDMVGNVTFGPPPRPLDEYQTRTEEGILYILFPPYKRSNA
jgi:menaquinol-cytochrome c reductase iron-sulfur subunit